MGKSSRLGCSGCEGKGAPTVLHNDAITTDRFRIRGGCLCCGVRYELRAPFPRANFCHCSRCRKHSGSAALAQGRVPASAFTLLQGHELLVSFTKSGHMGKVFCGRCGSSLFGGKSPDGPEVPFGTLDDDPAIRPSYHSFVQDVPAWDQLRRRRVAALLAATPSRRFLNRSQVQNATRSRGTPALSPTRSRPSDFCSRRSPATRSSRITARGGPPRAWRFVKGVFGVRSSATVLFLTHAVVTYDRDVPPDRKVLSGLGLEAGVHQGERDARARPGSRQHGS
jgi:hypothetical protein